MVVRGVKLAVWGALNMCNDWATPATIMKGIMYNAVFFEIDVSILLDLPSDIPYRQGLINVMKWHRDNEGRWATI